MISQKSINGKFLMNYCLLYTNQYTKPNHIRNNIFGYVV